MKLNWMKVFLIALMFSGVIASCSKDQGVNQDLVSADEQLMTKSAAAAVQDFIVVLYEDAALTSELQGKSYKERKNVVKGKAYGLLKKYGVSSNEIFQTYGKAVKGFAVKMNKTQAGVLAGDPAVALVEADQIIQLNAAPKGKPGGGTQPPQEVPWGITRVGGGATASGTAWIIDSGIDLDHPDLNVDVSRSVSFLTKGKDATDPNDGNGHGTHVSGTVAAIDNSIGVVGVAAGATVVAVRVLDKRGSGATSGVIAGVDYVAANGVAGDVANMSLGGGISTTLDDAVINASANVKFSLAAGNETDDANNHSPARVNGPNIYTISAMAVNDIWATFSNYGNPPIDYCAPGVSILSTYKDGAYATLSGTSMAAPHVAGLLLLGVIHSDGTVIGDPDGDPDPIAHN